MGVEFSRIVDALPDLVWALRADGACVYANRGWREYVGSPNDAPVRSEWIEVIHPDDAANVRAAWIRLAEDRLTAVTEARLRRFDGEYRWFAIRFRPLELEGSEAGWCGVASFADEGSVELSGYAEPDGRLRRFVDHLPSQVLFMTPELELEYVNREVVAFYGQPLEELKRWATSGRTHHPDDLPEVIARLERFREGEPWIHESRNLRADGAYRWVRSRMVPSRDAQANLVRYVSCQTDVHDLRQAEALLSGEVAVLEMVARGRPLNEVLEALCRLFESLSSAWCCSILTVSADRRCFEVAAAPSLPDEYRAGVDGKPVEPGDGPCSLAVVQKAAVFSADLTNDPRWEGSPWPARIEGYGYASCWAMPIFTASGEVSAVIAVHRPEAVGPGLDEEQLIDRCAKIAGIAIDRARADESLQLRDLELQRALAQLSAGQRLTKTGSFTSDVLLDRNSWSDEFYRLFEIPTDVPPSVQMVRERVHPDDLELFDYEMERAANGCHEADFVFRIVRPDGELRHIHGVARIAEHADGRPIFIGTVQDITESKLAEAALKESETKLRRANEELTRAYRQINAAQALSLTGSFTWDVAADEHQCSEGMYRILQTDPGFAVTTRYLRRLVHPEDRGVFDVAMRKARSGQPIEYSVRIRTAAGPVRFVHVVAQPLEEPDRRVFVGALQDVTASKLAEAALAASEAELRRANSYLTQAQRLSKTGSFTWDVLRDEHSWSEEIYRIFGFDPAAKVSTPINAASVHPDDMPDVERLIAGAQQGRDFDLFFRIVTPAGEIRHAHIVAHRLEEIEDRPVFVGALQDVTESRRAEEALTQARAELAHVARVTALSALTASIAHEIGQPLAGILTNANTCLRMLAANPPRLEIAAETARRTIRDTNRVAEVIKRLRALFQKQAPTDEPVDLNEAAREVIALSVAELRRARVVVQTDLQPDLPTVRGDRVQLQQVILNLLLNAADAMSEVESRPRRLFMETRDEGTQVRLSVRDVGPGFAPGVLPRLFDAFYTTKPQGMGVGLSISRSIIESHEGRLWATPNDGPGATFSFSLPAGPSGAEHGDAAGH